MLQMSTKAVMTWGVEEVGLLSQTRREHGSDHALLRCHGDRAELRETLTAYGRGFYFRPSRHLQSRKRNHKPNAMRLKSR